MLKVIIILIVVVFGFVLYAGGKVAKSADQWEKNWWDKQKGTELYVDDDGQTENH